MLIDQSKVYTTDMVKTDLKRVILKTAEATVNRIANKITNKFPGIASTKPKPTELPKGSKFK